MEQNPLIPKIKSILEKRTAKSQIIKGLVPSAILIPLFYKDNSPHLLLTRRSQLVEHHKGEISFPGGTLDKTDKSLLSCALRECQEEIGLQADDVEILGQMDDFRTVATHFVVTPFVGLIPHPYPFQINKYEIDELIIVPISSLINPSNYKEKEKRAPDSKIYTLDYFYYDQHIIWGATGYILKQFLKLVFDFQSKYNSHDIHHPINYIENID